MEGRRRHGGGEERGRPEEWPHRMGEGARGEGREGEGEKRQMWPEGRGGRWVGAVAGTGLV